MRRLARNLTAGLSAALLLPTGAQARPGDFDHSLGKRGRVLGKQGYEARVVRTIGFREDYGTPHPLLARLLG